MRHLVCKSSKFYNHCTTDIKLLLFDLCTDYTERTFSKLSTMPIYRKIIKLPIWSNMQVQCMTKTISVTLSQC